MDDKLLTPRCCDRRAQVALRLALVLGPIAAGPLGCASPIGTTAASALIHVQNDPDPNHRFLAYSKLGSPNLYDTKEQKTEAIQLLIAKLEKEHEPVASRAVICRTLGALGATEARLALVRAVDDPDGTVRAEACRALGKVGQPEDGTVLCRIMATDMLLDCKVAAIDGLSELKAGDPRVLLVLVEGMENDLPAIRFASVNALKAITRKDLGLETGPWRKYVQEQAQAAVDAAKAPNSLPKPGPTTPAPPSDPAVKPARGSWFNPAVPAAPAAKPARSPAPTFMYTDS